MNRQAQRNGRKAAGVPKSFTPQEIAARTARLKAARAKRWPERDYEIRYEYSDGDRLTVRTLTARNIKQARQFAMANYPNTPKRKTTVRPTGKAAR